MTNKHMKKMFNTTNQKNANQNHMKYHLTPISYRKDRKCASSSGIQGAEAR